LPASRTVYVSLPTDAAEALCELSRREFRHPRDQAQKLLLEGLWASGALPKEATTLTEAAREAVPA
jgi:hypothetical protein